MQVCHELVDALLNLVPVPLPRFKVLACFVGHSLAADFGNVLHRGWVGMLDAPKVG